MNFGVTREFGGLALSILDTCLIQEELNYGCSGISNSFSANDLAALPLLIAGNAAQQRLYLGGLIEKLSFCAFALTEPGAGSDVAAMSTTYRRDGDAFVLNGTKHFISNGSMADWMVTFATSDKRLKHQGISCFVLHRTSRASHAIACTASSDSAPPTPARSYSTRCASRPTLWSGKRAKASSMRWAPSIAAVPKLVRIAIGVSQRALDESLKYSRQRSAFGQPIANFQAIQFMLADMAVSIEAMRLLTYKAAWMVDRGEVPNPISSYAKLFGSEACMKITTDAVQIFDGYVT